MEEWRRERERVLKSVYEFICLTEVESSECKSQREADSVNTSI